MKTRGILFYIFCIVVGIGVGLIANNLSGGDDNDSGAHHERRTTLRIADTRNSGNATSSTETPANPSITSVPVNEDRLTIPLAVWENLGVRLIRGWPEKIRLDTSGAAALGIDENSAREVSSILQTAVSELLSLELANREIVEVTPTRTVFVVKEHSKQVSDVLSASFHRLATLGGETFAQKVIGAASLTIQYYTRDFAQFDRYFEVEVDDKYTHLTEKWNGEELKHTFASSQPRVIHRHLLSVSIDD